ncbi:MAG TPA: hypothetical protein VL326_23060 [Kofleriaceae bacterium]|nr:hypothetical protein [Kofleriaceae bacterium]
MTEDAPAHVDVGTNILGNASCEGDVAPWIGYFADVTLGTPGRTGATSCQVCRLGGSTASTLDPSTGTNDAASPAVGTTWHAHAWVRMPAGATGIRSRISLRQWTTGTTSGAQTQSSGVDLSDTDWTLVEASHTVEAPAPQYLDSFVDLLGNVGDCVLVDDLWLGQVP